MTTFEYFYVDRNGLWKERVQEVKEKGFLRASPIARLIYECEVGDIDQHASEDLKIISAVIATCEATLSFGDAPASPAEEAHRAAHRNEPLA